MAVLLLALGLNGCASEAQGTPNWSAEIAKAAEGVVVSVDVPGQKLGIDYHIHLSLDGGPEVMAFTRTYTFRRLTPGVHRLRVIIADPSHVPIRGMERTLEVQIP